MWALGAVEYAWSISCRKRPPNQALVSFRLVYVYESSFLVWLFSLI